MRNARLIALAAMVSLPTTGADAQDLSGAVLAEFQKIEGTIIRIRTIADLEFSRIDMRTGEARPADKPYSIDGTGIIVGETMVGDRTEYFILTNHHVADASNYVLEEGGYLRVNPSNTLAVPSVNEESYLLAAARDSVTADDIRLVEVVRRVEGDMTLMRTDGANRKLPIYDGPIGYSADEVGPGARVATSGYPWGGRKMFAIGSILEVEFPHELGMPHADLIVDLPVEPGQSGGPVFLLEETASPEEPVHFRLIGLIHARDRHRNYAVPYRTWGKALGEFPEELRERMVPMGDR